MSISTKSTKSTKNQTNWIDCGDFWEHQSPQGTDEWLEVKIGRVTGSVSGALAGRSRFKTPEEIGLIIAGVKKEIFDDSKKEIMSHGTKIEPDARKWLANHYNLQIKERNLIVPKSDVLIGASIDGEIINPDGTSDTIIEIKCPQKMYKLLDEYMNYVNNGMVPPKNYIDHIWPTHYDQMQHGMAVLGKKWCYYVVYCTPESKVFVQKIPFDRVYWEKHYKIIKENYKKYVEPHLKPGYPLIPTYKDILLLKR